MLVHESITKKKKIAGDGKLFDVFHSILICEQLKHFNQLKMLIRE